MDEARLAEIEARAERTYRHIEAHAEPVILDVEWLVDGAIEPLIAEVRRLQADLAMWKDAAAYDEQWQQRERRSPADPPTLAPKHITKLS